MAYMNQEKKAQIAAALKKVMPKDWRYSLAVRNYSEIVMTIRKGPSNLMIVPAHGHVDEHIHAGIYRQVNPHSYKDNFLPEFDEIFAKIYAALNSAGNYDNSDIMTDYFDVGYYVSLRVGDWDAAFLPLDK